MGQKIEYNFQSKKGSILCILTSFFPRTSGFQMVCLFSLFKSVGMIFLQRLFESRCLIYKYCVTYNNGATYSKTYTAIKGHNKTKLSR